MKIKIHFLSIAITGVVAMFFFTTACKNDVKDVHVATHEMELPLRVQYHIHYEYSDSANKTLDIMAPEAVDFSNLTEPYLEFPQGIEVKMYNKQKIQMAYLRSNYAKSYDNQQMFEARGDVVVINNKEEKLNTELLFWDRKKEKIYSDKFVTITTKDNILQGYGFEADQNFEKWRIYNLEATIAVDDETQDSTKNNPN